jgi:hypothetical protein
MSRLLQFFAALMEADRLLDPWHCMNFGVFKMGVQKIVIPSRVRYKIGGGYVVTWELLVQPGTDFDRFVPGIFGAG